MDTITPFQLIPKVDDLWRLMSNPASCAFDIGAVFPKVTPELVARGQVLIERIEQTMHQVKTNPLYFRYRVAVEGRFKQELQQLAWIRLAEAAQGHDAVSLAEILASMIRMDNNHALNDYASTLWCDVVCNDSKVPLDYKFFLLSHVQATVLVPKCYGNGSSEQLEDLRKQIESGLRKNVIPEHGYINSALEYVVKAHYHELSPEPYLMPIFKEMFTTYITPVFYRFMLKFVAMWVDKACLFDLGFPQSDLWTLLSADHPTIAEWKSYYDEHPVVTSQAPQ